MSPEPKPDDSASWAQISAEDFPVLRDFLRGYLHEDWKDEYGSMEQAVGQFSKDASPEEWRALQREWGRFRKRTHSLAPGAVGRLLTLGLGGAWHPIRLEELDSLTEALRHVGKG